MLLLNNKAGVFIYILLLINIGFIMSVMVYNNSFVLSNNIDVGKNSQEIFSNIYNKGNIAIESVKKYNSNGNGFMDAISCPTNITMSGSTSSGTNISTSMVYDLGNIYCLGSYNGKNFRIYYNEEYQDFKNAYYEGDVVDIIRPVGEYIDMTNNLATSATVTATSLNINKGISIASINDSYTGTTTNAEKHAYYSEKVNTPYITIEMPSTYSVGLVRIYNSAFNSNERKKLNGAKIKLYDGTDTLVKQTTIGNADFLIIDKEFNYSASVTNPAKRVKIEKVGTNKDIALIEIEIYEWKYGPSDVWLGNRVFSDSDSTFLSFDATGIGGMDGLDDDFNSDDYNVGSNISSTGSVVYYINGYQDDDVVPRKTFFGNIISGKENKNIFWSNYKTNDFLNNNTNNNDVLNIKIGDVTAAYLHLDIYNTSENIFDLKILEFDRNSYKNEFTLLPIATSKGQGLTETVGYIQKNTGELSLSKVKTGNEYEFDFKNSDYAVFLSNISSGNLAYRLESETITGTGIYINPIDDSGTGVISVMSNHLMIGGEKNFIGDNFEIVGSK